MPDNLSAEAIRFKKNAAASMPPSGAVDLRFNQQIDELIVQDNRGIEAVVAAVPSYLDQTAANAAEAAQVLYYNQSTGKFQVTTA
jgi:hypothetical protein